MQREVARKRFLSRFPGVSRIRGHAGTNTSGCVTPKSQLSSIFSRTPTPNRSPQPAAAVDSYASPTTAPYSAGNARVTGAGLGGSARSVASPSYVPSLTSPFEHNTTGSGIENTVPDHDFQTPELSLTPCSPTLKGGSTAQSSSSPPGPPSSGAGTGVNAVGYAAAVSGEIVPELASAHCQSPSFADPHSDTSAVAAAPLQPSIPTAEPHVQSKHDAVAREESGYDADNSDGSPTAQHAQHVKSSGTTTPEVAESPHLSPVVEERASEYFANDPALAKEKQMEIQAAEAKNAVATGVGGEVATGGAADDDDKRSSFKHRKTQGGIVSVGTRTNFRRP